MNDVEFLAWARTHWWGRALFGTASANVVRSGVGQRGVMKLAANVHRACKKCGAPGVYRSELSIKREWPGCYSVKKAGQPVGAECPNCGAKRPKDEPVKFANGGLVNG